MLVGHGLRSRQVLGPTSFGAAPEALVVPLRRYRCRACRAVVVVGPRGLVHDRSYSAPAIAGALAAMASGARGPNGVGFALTDFDVRSVELLSDRTRLDVDFALEVQ